MLIGTVVASAQVPPNVQDTQRKFNEAYERQDWGAAIGQGKLLAGLRPQDAGVAYNLACVCALGGKVDEAIRWLQTSAELGFADTSLVESDTDLDAVRSAAGYGKAIAAVKANASTAMTDFLKLPQHDPFIVLPPKHDPEVPAPLIVALHPFGGTATAFIETWKPIAAKAGAILVAPQATRLSGSGYQWGTIAEANHILKKAIVAASSRGRIDASRTLLTGFSQGGYMTFNLGMRHLDFFTGLIPVAGQYVPSQAPPTTGGKQPRVFLMIGADDRAVASNRQAAEDYRRAGMAVELRVYPGVGHAFPADRTTELTTALKFVWQSHGRPQDTPEAKKQ
jgi:predicted esterase